MSLVCGLVYRQHVPQAGVKLAVGGHEETVVCVEYLFLSYSCPSIEDPRHMPYRVVSVWKLSYRQNP